MTCDSVTFSVISPENPVDAQKCSMGAGREDLQKFLIEEALDVYRQQIAHTLVATLDGQVIAFVTYGIGSIKHEYPDAVTVGVDSHIGYDVPAVRIYQLAVAEAFERNGLGSILMDHVFQVTKRLRAIMPCPQLIVTSYSSAVPFYKRFGFEKASSAAQKWVAPNVLLLAVLPEED